jgi:thymidylate synthase
MTVDVQYRDLLRYILKTGKFHNDPNRVNVRRLNVPKYQFQVPIDTVPAISLKKSFPMMAMKELSLFMRGETDIRKYWEAGVNFWTEDWYNFRGYKTGIPIEDVKDNHSDIDFELFDMGKVYSYQYRKFGGTFDQMEDIMRKMIERPMDSSIVVNIWNPRERKQMTLAPCHYGFNVDMEKVEYGSKTGYGFHLSWVMRSSDVFLGLPMNIMYYFYLGKVLEVVTGHKMLSLTGDLHNVHLYDNSIDDARDVILNKPKHIHKLENLVFSDYLFGDIKNYKAFWDGLPLDAVRLENYDSYRHYKVPMLPYQ